MNNPRLFYRFITILMIGLISAPILALAGVDKGLISLDITVTIGLATQTWAIWRIGILHEYKADEIASRIVGEISKTNMSPIEGDLPRIGP